MENQQEINLGTIEAIAEGKGKAFNVEGRSIAVFRPSDGTLYAVQNYCPHAGGPLAYGYLGGNSVICPLHGWKFNLTSGVCAHDDFYKIRTYPVRVQDGEILVQID